MEWYKWVIIIILIFALYRISKSKGKAAPKKSRIDNLDDDLIWTFEFKNSITGEDLIYEIYRFDDLMDWNSAVEACKKLQHGWRLPDVAEFELLYRDLPDMWHLYSGYLWSISKWEDDDKAFRVRIPPKDMCGLAGIQEKRTFHLVIAVRTI